MNSLREAALAATRAAVMQIQGALGGVADALIGGLRGALGTLADVLLGFVNALRTQVLQPILNAITGAFEAATGALRSLTTTVFDTIRQLAPHSPAGGLEASLIMAGVAATLTVVGVAAATAVDALHPFHSLEIKQAVLAGLATTGVSSIGPTVVGTYLNIALIKPMVQELNETFIREIPGPSDLVRFVVREQISPPELELYLKRQGFGPKWSQAFWGAHWLIPSRAEAVELYHRGRYTLQDVTKWLELNDLRPDTIPDLLELTFRTPSRAELERIAEVSDVPEPQLRAWLRADGVSEELLPTYLTMVRGRRLIRILTRVESLVRTEVEAGRLQVEEARQLMQEFRFAPEVIDLELRVATRARQLQVREETRKILIESFRKGQLAKGELVEELRALGLDVDLVGSTVALEELRRLPKPKLG